MFVPVQEVLQQNLCLTERYWEKRRVLFYGIEMFKVWLKLS
jgi:hypothetical protein